MTAETTAAGARSLSAPLGDCVVADLSSGIAGAYCTKLLADGGADVVKIEDPGGDPLRRWSASGAPIAPGEDGALFQFLSTSKSSLCVDASATEDGEALCRLLDAASIIVCSHGSQVAALPDLSARTLHARLPHSVVVSLTPFGLDGPWANRAASELTVQAWAGGIGHRGDARRAPVSVGGRTGEWLAGLMAAVAALSSHWRAVHTGVGDLVDVSMLETLALTNTLMHPVTFASMAQRPFRRLRSHNIPSIEPTKDGYVGFMVATGQQWQDFCVLIERFDWMGDESLVKYENRAARGDEILQAIRQWCGQHTTDEVIELASALRIPVAPIGNGELAPHFDHLVEGGFIERNPHGGFIQPAVPYRFHGRGAAPRPAEPAPRLGEGSACARAAARGAATPRRTSTDATTPFGGLRVVEFTSFWAGPIIGQYLGALGADVIHIESTRRVDGMRHHVVRPMTEEQWWEWAPLYQATNTNKRGLALDMVTEAGRHIARRLIQCSDVVVDSVTPRVLEGWAFDYAEIRRPGLIMLRAPAFGLTGPWRDRTAYAQTIEQVSGMAWVTGHPEDPPVVPNGLCDPLAGLHALVALMLALEHRRKTGEGTLVEVPMVAGALNVAAEQVIEHTAYGRLIGRTGNRGPTAAPQNLYLTADRDEAGRQDRWVAISVESDDQWARLSRALADPAWAADPTLQSAAGRHAAHDVIDEHLAAWCAERSSDEVVYTLWRAGVPAAKVLMPHEQVDVEQLQARGAFESVHHPVTGDALHIRFPVRFAAGPAQHHRMPAPLLGQHNAEILIDLLGLSVAEVEQLERDGIVGRVAGRNPFAATASKD